MYNYPMTSEEVKQLLGVDDFSELNTDQIRIFVSEIPRMDTDVAISAIEQFPSYEELVKELSTQFYTVSEKVIESNNVSVQRVQEAYEQTLELMSLLAQREDLDLDDRKWFAEKTVEIADKMADFDRQNKGYLTDTRKTGAKVIGGILLACVTIFGFMFFNSKNDRSDS